MGNWQNELRKLHSDLFSNSRKGKNNETISILD